MKISKTTNFRAGAAKAIHLLGLRAPNQAQALKAHRIHAPGRFSHLSNDARDKKMRLTCRFLRRNETWRPSWTSKNKSFCNLELYTKASPRFAFEVAFSLGQILIPKPQYSNPYLAKHLGVPSMYRAKELYGLDSKFACPWVIFPERTTSLSFSENSARLKALQEARPTPMHEEDDVGMFHGLLDPDIDMRWTDLMDVDAVGEEATGITLEPPFQGPVDRKDFQLSEWPHWVVHSEAAQGPTEACPGSPHVLYQAPSMTFPPTATYHQRPLQEPFVALPQADLMDFTPTATYQQRPLQQQSMPLPRAAPESVLHHQQVPSMNIQPSTHHHHHQGPPQQPSLSFPQANPQPVLHQQQAPIRFGMATTQVFTSFGSRPVNPSSRLVTEKVAQPKPSTPAPAAPQQVVSGPSLQRGRPISEKSLSLLIQQRREVVAEPNPWPVRRSRKGKESEFSLNLGPSMPDEKVAVQPVSQQERVVVNGVEAKGKGKEKEVLPGSSDGDDGQSGPSQRGAHPALFAQSNFHSRATTTRLSPLSRSTTTRTSNINATTLLNTPVPQQMQQMPAPKKVTVSLDNVDERFHDFVEEAMNASAEITKPTPDWWKHAAVNDSEAEKTTSYTIRSVTQYASFPPQLKVTPQFHSPDPTKRDGEFNTRASCRLGHDRNVEERKRFSTIQKDCPEVWHALIGTMLQEGVSIDSMLIEHETRDQNGNVVDLRPQVLKNQKWVADNWRFDQLRWHSVQGTQLPASCSADFHNAPKSHERLYNETLTYMKQHPEICYLFRTLVSLWLNKEENQEIFRGIVRKAGWVPEKQHKVKRDYVKWVMTEAPGDISNLCSQYLAERYYRFFSATCEELQIDII